MSAYRGSSESNAASTPQLGVSLSSTSVTREDSVVLNQRFAGGFCCPQPAFCGRILLSSTSVLWEDSVVLNLHYAGGFC